MRPITLILPFYDNPGMLLEQQRAWADLPDAVRAQLHVIVVDDGSPTAPAMPAWAPPDGLGSARLYRCLVDVRWNWLFCRNLGVREATTEWVFLTDIDHVPTESALRVFMESDIDGRSVYRLNRVDAPDLTPKMKDGRQHAHPNTWVMTRAMYQAIGGYDERLSGYYGTDADFRDRVHEQTARQGGAVVLLSEVMVRYPREVIPDASTTTYGRKEPQDGMHVKRIKQERSRIKGWKPLTVTYPWERLR